jgi:tRNA (guanosine-2'-O-)-methyltransferase
MSPERFARLKAVLDHRQPDLTVLMEHIDKPHNLAAIVRTADAVGLYEVHTVRGRQGMRVSPSVSSGSRKWVALRTHEDPPCAFGHLRERGFASYVADLAPGARDYREVDYTRPVAIVPGTELYGVSSAARELADGAIHIPMEGMIASLNVSVATALILYEARRQREAAGLYDRPRLDPELYRKTLFEWAWPDVAAICRIRGLPYPELDELGGLSGDLSRLSGGEPAQPTL